MDKEMQKDRMKKYFVDAAREILINEGVQNVSVRRVGEATGYSYATIYNYFKNLDHLLWCVGLDILQGFIKMYEDDFIKDDYTSEDILQLLKRYINYYFENPNVFKFFFFYEPNELPEELKGELTRPSLSKILVKILERLSEKGTIPQEKITVIGHLLVDSVHGMLLMLFSKKRMDTKEELYNKLEKTISFLLG